MQRIQRESIGSFWGTRVVAALVITSFVPLSLGLSCAGIFYPSLAGHLGVGEGVLSYYTTVLWIAAVLTLPLSGRFLAKADARACLAGAVALMAAAFVWLSLVRSLWQFYAGAFAMGIGVGMLLFLAPSTLINRWFVKRAGVMLGICMAFTGVGGAVWSSVGGALIASVGWSTTYLVFAALSALTLPAAVFLVASRPEDKGLVAFGSEDGARAAAGAASKGSAGTAVASGAGTGAEGAPAGSAAGMPSAAGAPGKAAAAGAAANAPAPTDASVGAAASGVAAAHAFKMPLFYLIAALAFFLNLAMPVYFMIPSYAATLAIGIALPLLGATASSVAMAGQTVSKLVLGAVGERLPQAGTLVALGCGAVGAAAFVALSGSVGAYYVAALLYGAYYGITNVMMPLFTRRAFGDADYPRIYARVSMVASVSNAAGAFLWGTLVEVTGGYVPMFAGAVVVMAAAAACVVAIRKASVRQRADRLG